MGGETTVATPDRHARSGGPRGVAAREGYGGDDREAIPILVAAGNTDLPQDVERSMSDELHTDLRADQEVAGFSRLSISSSNWRRATLSTCLPRFTWARAGEHHLGGARERRSAARLAETDDIQSENRSLS